MEEKVSILVVEDEEKIRSALKDFLEFHNFRPATAEDGPAWIEGLLAVLKIPGLSDWGLTEAMIPDLVAFSRRASSMKGNPVPLDDAVLHGVIRRAL